MIKVFSGYDRKESIGYHVFCQSILNNSSRPVSITPLHIPMLRGYSDDKNSGTNAFNRSRFLIPALCNYEGFAIFMDGADMLIRSDIKELWGLCDPDKAVQVVKHVYKTKFDRKYIGTKMECNNEDYPRKNWSSLMLINCAHPQWRMINFEFVENASSGALHRFSWMDESEIGELPKQWNHLVGEYPFEETAKLAHFTLGIPSFEHYRLCDYADEWWSVHNDVLGDLNGRQ